MHYDKWGIKKEKDWILRLIKFKFDLDFNNDILNDIYSIDVQDYITINTLAHIIKDKENMTEHNFVAIRLISSGIQYYPLPLLVYPGGRAHAERYGMLNKLNDIPNLNDDSHINIVFRLRG